MLGTLVCCQLAVDIESFLTAILRTHEFLDESVCPHLVVANTRVLLVLVVLEGEA